MTVWGGRPDTLWLDEGPGELRLAALAGDRAWEIGHHRAAAPDLAGAVFRARVRRIEPAMNAAFVDLGPGQQGFLRARDMPAAAMPGASMSGARLSGARLSGARRRRIAALSQEGAAVVVQWQRAAATGKTAIVSGFVALPGRFFDYWPVGHPQGQPGRDPKPAGQPETPALTAPEQISLHPEAARASAAGLQAELDTLRARWRDIAGATLAAPAMLAPGPGPVARFMARYRQAPIRHILANGLAAGRAARDWCAAFDPDRADRIHVALAGNGGPDPAALDYEIDAALQDDCPVPGGGTLLIEPGRTLTAIDVNSGGRHGRHLDTNIAALDEIARQCRLRRLGGAIVIDVIGTGSRDERRRLLAAARRLFADDPSPCRVIGMSPAGLLEMTRRRDGPSLAGELCADRAGPVWLADAAGYRALRQLGRVRRRHPAGGLRLSVAPAVAGWLATGPGRTALTAAGLDRALVIESRPALPPDRAEIAPAADTGPAAGPSHQVHGEGRIPGQGQTPGAGRAGLHDRI